MKALASLLLALAVASLGACGGTGDAPAEATPAATPTITILSPNGGETWAEGVAQSVTWASTGFAGNVDIEYSVDGGTTWMPLALDAPNDGTWLGPAPSVDSANVRIQVSAADGDPLVAKAPADQCDAAFTIEPRIVLTSPIGGEYWEIGSIPAVTWIPGAYAGNVDIEYSVDGGLTWLALAVDTPNDGTEDVTVPAAPGPDVRVQVSAADGDPVSVAQPGDEAPAGLQIGGDPALAVSFGSLHAGDTAWADFDGDGDLDVLMTGTNSNVISHSRLYRNDGGTWVNSGASLLGVQVGDVAWGDYDGDGDPDLALCGLSRNTSASGQRTRIYRNDGGGTFTDIGAGLPGAESLDWGDYDGDGDLDLALVGRANGNNGTGAASRIYRNDAGVFTDIAAGLPVAWWGPSVEWGDYDGDGDLDLVLSGMETQDIVNDPPKTRIFRNDGGAFTDIGAGLIGIAAGDLCWGDYDGDGDLDLAMCGDDAGIGGNPLARVYRNDEGTFVNISAGLPALGGIGTVAWGDYDNDGDLDLAVAGTNASFTQVARVYENDGGVFTDLGLGLPGRRSFAWGDYDRDGDLDIALAGINAPRVYRNQSGFAPNTAPTAPAQLEALVGGSHVTLLWTEGSDAETPTEALTYNLRIGTTSAGHDAYSGAADASGLRAIAARGAWHPDPFFQWAWFDLPPGTYYASVQAIDTSLAGGAWSDPVEFTIP